MPARKSMGHGGRRPGAGRPKKPGAISHLTRPPIDARVPQLVALQLGEQSPSIGHARLMTRVIQPCASSSEKPFFRVDKIAVVGDQVHIICRADDAESLARGIQGLSIRLARGLNSALNRTGKLFGPRYQVMARKR